MLGVEARDDITLGEDFRWVTVGHPSQPELDLQLATPSKPPSDDLIAPMQRAQAEGGLPGVGLKVDDCRRTHRKLVAKGVEFIQEPEDRPNGVEALMRDNSGNWIVLVEPKEFSESDFDGFEPSCSRPTMGTTTGAKTDPWKLMHDERALPAEDLAALTEKHGPHHHCARN